MPKGKGKKAQQSNTPNFSLFPRDLDQFITRISSIITLAKAARAGKVFNRFYLFKCDEALRKGDDLAAEQIFYHLKLFAMSLDTALIKKPNNLAITTKFGLLLTKLKDAFLMARNEKLKSEIASYYFYRLQNEPHYTTTDNLEINTFSNHLMSQIPTIDSAAYICITPCERRLLLLSRLETLRQKSKNPISLCLVTAHIREAIAAFKKETLAFTSELEKNAYEAKLKEHEVKLTQELDMNQNNTAQALVLTENPIKKREGCIIS